MSPIIIPAPQTIDSAKMMVKIHLETEVISAEVARRKANVWLLENVGNLLRAESPELIVGEPLVWRVDIVLTSPTKGWVGRLGRLEMNATTADILTDCDSLVQEITPRAHTLAAN